MAIASRAAAEQLQLMCWERTGVGAHGCQSTFQNGFIQPIASHSRICKDLPQKSRRRWWHHFHIIPPVYYFSSSLVSPTAEEETACSTAARLSLGDIKSPKRILATLNVKDLQVHPDRVQVPGNHHFPLMPSPQSTSSASEHCFR